MQRIGYESIPVVFLWRGFRMMVCGLWRSLVARRTGGAKVAGSNPVSPTLSIKILKTGLDC